MSYTLGIPSDGQSLGNSKPQVRGNFTTIYNAFAVNHVALDSIPLGIHTKVDLKEITDPSPAVGMNTLYSKISGIPLGELYFIRGGSADTIQMTNGTPTNASTGITFLPGGVIMQWGKVTLNGSGVKTVSFSPTFRLAGVNTSPWNIQVTFADTSFTTVRCVGISSVAYNQFNISSFAGANQDVFWTAIGPRT